MWSTTIVAVDRLIPPTCLPGNETRTLLRSRSECSVLAQPADLEGGKRTNRTSFQFLVDSTTMNCAGPAATLGTGRSWTWHTITADSRPAEPSTQATPLERRRVKLETPHGVERTFSFGAGLEGRSMSVTVCLARVPRVCSTSVLLPLPLGELEQRVLAGMRAGACAVCSGLVVSLEALRLWITFGAFDVWVIPVT